VLYCAWSRKVKEGRKYRGGGRVLGGMRLLMLKLRLLMADDLKERRQSNCKK
jgi:hypothetical protein